MGIPDVGQLSLGEFSAEVSGWYKAHGKDTSVAPSEEDFDRAVMAARGAV